MGLEWFVGCNIWGTALMGLFCYVFEVGLVVEGARGFVLGVCAGGGFLWFWGGMRLG